MSEQRWMIYGATGFTGELLAEEAVRRGLRPTLAGRSPQKLEKLGARFGLPTVAVDLGDAAGLRRALEGHAAVVHCAGPFVHTADPMREACLEVGVHYLDITGELTVFEGTFALDRRARERGILMVSGVGFDVVPTDCLARHVSEQIADPTELEIAFAAVGNPSGGTARSGVGILAAGGQVRRDGLLVPGPLGTGGRWQRFAHRDRYVAPFPWGDLVTAFHTTGIPNITTYMGMPPKQARFLSLAHPALKIALKSGRVRGLLGELAGRQAKGPNEGAMKHGRSNVWARVRNAKGDEAQAWLETIEAYRLTAITGVLAAQRAIAGTGALKGALSPARAFGADFILEVPDTQRFDRLPGEG